jgi:hypothetical protein
MEAFLLFSGSHSSIDLIKFRNKRLLPPSSAVIESLREIRGMATPPEPFH